MTRAELLNRRLVNQQIAHTSFSDPAEIVGWLGAMQSQEYALAKWAIGLRLPGIVDAQVEKAFNEGKILRTHVLRPTWHFVTPADIRWMLALTAPRVKSVSASMFRKMELDAAVFRRSNKILEKTLGGKHCTRTVLKEALEKAKIPAVGIRLGYLLINAELDGVICSGPRQGNQFTYALLDERAPAGTRYGTEEALAELTRRYFTSRGPATVPDFVWWSGLTIKQARAGVAMLPADFLHEWIGGQEYIFTASRSVNSKPGAGFQKTFLLPDYDEYGISYKNRDAIFDRLSLQSASTETLSRGGNILFNHMIVIDGRIGGTWKRSVKQGLIHVETALFSATSKIKQPAVNKAVKRYLQFLAS